MTPQKNSLQRIVNLLAEIRVIPQAAAALEASKSTAAGKLRHEVLAQIPAFSISGNPEILPGLDAHVAEHIQEILRLFAGGKIGDFEFIRAHARRRAEQRFPLEAMLDAYRYGHRTFVIWLRDAALAMESKDEALSAVADFAVEYTNISSSIIASEYVAYTRILAEAEGDRRTELLNILLSGYDESDGRVAQLLKRAGYLEQRQAYCVAAVQSINRA